jgi:alkylation response protein AidB-like acyl-CoA dehydrogenase
MMDFRFTKEEERFRAEARRFFTAEVGGAPPLDPEDEAFVPKMRAILRKLGDRGWLTMTWPREYGGQDASPMYRFIILEEMALSGLTSSGGFNTGGRIVGPTLIQYGTEEQKKFFLPKIAKYEIDFALGYTEPEAGSDLASLKMQAIEDGDEFVITGQKMYNTTCHWAEYHWLAVRTDPKAPKHKGISLFMVDMKSPGIKLTPMYAVSGARTNAVFYDGVRVPKSRLVGEKNKGFYYASTALAYERIFNVGMHARMLENIIAYAKATKRHGKPLWEQLPLQREVARHAAKLRALRLLCYKVGWQMSNKIMPSYEASSLKVMISEFEKELVHTGMEMLGHYGELEAGSKYVLGEGAFAQAYHSAPLATITGGASEIQRNVIATRGLGLPRGD